MAKRDILAEYGINPEDVQKEIEASLMGLSGEQLEKTLDESVKDYTVNTILEGRVVSVGSDEVMVDVGYKSEGAIPKNEWENGQEAHVGDTIEVLLEAVEDDSGLVQLSKRKADRIRNWERVVTHHEEGGVVTGTRHAQDQGRPAGGHRRARLPAGQPGGHPPAGRDRRLHRPRS